MRLYLVPISGNSYKVRILLSLLNVPYEKVVVDHIKKEHKQPAFLKLNPRGEVPVLEDDGTVIWDSAACLIYVARKHGGEQWLPTAPAELAEVMQWIALAGEEIQFGLQYARRGVLQDRWTAGTLEQCQATGRVALAILETRLKNNEWLALGRPTIADIACFPYVETAPEAQLPLEPYTAIGAWLARCKALRGWTAR
ncbi:MAG: glutathione S-transferase family protein [Betaproteobacteria bacterium]|nr:glutathione S-transferase family protein [Betaproteobacteria bacterium]